MGKPTILGMVAMYHIYRILTLIRRSFSIVFD